MIQRLWLEIQKFIANHLLLVVFLTVLFAISVAFGAIVVQALQTNQKNELYMYINNFLLYLGQEPLSPKLILWESLSQNLKYLGILWVLGLSVIGLPVIIVMIFAKGFSLGFTVAFLIDQYAGKGLQLAIAAIFPQNLILVPVTLFVGVAGIVFSMQLIQNRILQSGESLFNKFINYLFIIIVSIILVIIASFYEAYIAPYFYSL
ncbi:stage II sporulation protein M [Desulfuribacillus alkaliarsenatis]|uniref:Stage II sporulation protein M n=1 Tax=Desulfuribacillus alkaliarsenatis TaxID=766136 RepID=A0A1E5G5K5_9FIRM|nr:stage II sporulation protein M [Desulfuribacillus alkaliarsenatis]OEF98470.1 stage II sporulation protein M [Desulfuribacillus alkaliarsenatis]